MSEAERFWRIQVRLRNGRLLTFRDILAEDEAGARAFVADWYSGATVELVEPEPGSGLPALPE